MELLEKIINYNDYEGFYNACERGYVEIVKLIIKFSQNKFRIHRKNDYRGYALALKNNHRKICLFLIEEFG